MHGEGTHETPPHVRDCGQLKNAGEEVSLSSGVKPVISSHVLYDAHSCSCKQPSLNSVSQKIRFEVKRGLVGRKSFRTDMGWQMVMDGVNDQNSEYSHMQVSRE